MLPFSRGVLPFTERKLLITQFQDKNRSFNTSSGNSLFGRGNQIQEGSQVCLRSRPIYSSGCQAFYIKGPVVKCGELQESVFSLSEKCRFKILPECNGEVVEPMEILSEVISIDDNPSVGEFIIYCIVLVMLHVHVHVTKTCHVHVTTKTCNKYM